MCNIRPLLPAISWRGSVGMSTYNGLSVAMRRSFSRGLLVTANYMWSHEIDNGSNGSGDGDEVDPQNPPCQACDTASGAWDARHVVNGNAVYQLPFGLGKPMLNQPGIASAIAGNWQLTTTALARTGFPVNVLMPSSYTAPDGASGEERPDLVPGVSLTPPGGKTWAVDQSARLQLSGHVQQFSFWRCAARPGARAGHMADRSGRRQDISPAGAGTVAIPLGVLQRFQSPAARSANRYMQSCTSKSRQLNLAARRLRVRFRTDYPNGKPQRIACNSRWNWNPARDTVRTAAGFLTRYQRRRRSWLALAAGQETGCKSAAFGATSGSSRPYHAGHDRRRPRPVDAFRADHGTYRHSRHVRGLRSRSGHSFGKQVGPPDEVAARSGAGRVAAAHVLRSHRAARAHWTGDWDARLAAFRSGHSCRLRGQVRRQFGGGTVDGLQLARRLGAGHSDEYERIRRSDESRTAPGSETLQELFGGEPTLILLDELVGIPAQGPEYAGGAGPVDGLPHGLFKAVESTPNAVLVYTLAVGRDGKAQDAYAQENQFLAEKMAEAESVSARKATLLNPTEDDETVLVLRRRLFESIDENLATQAVDAYRALWSAQRDSIPGEALKPEIVESFRRSYPFHPEVLDTLTGKTATLGEFPESARDAPSPRPHSGPSLGKGQSAF